MHLQLHRRAVRVGRRRPRRLRLLRSGQLCADRRAIRAMAPRTRSWACPRSPTRSPATSAPVQRAHCGIYIGGGQMAAPQPSARRYASAPCQSDMIIVAPLVAFPASAARRQAFKLAASEIPAVNNEPPSCSSAWGSCAFPGALPVTAGKAAHRFGLCERVR